MGTSGRPGLRQCFEVDRRDLDLAGNAALRDRIDHQADRLAQIVVAGHTHLGAAGPPTDRPSVTETVTGRR